MLKRIPLFKVAALMIAVVLLFSLAVSSSAAQTNTWQPDQPPAGMGSVVFINQIGKGGGVSVDLDGTVYQVPDKAGTTPGRVQLNLAPGTYPFTASAFDLATTHSVKVQAGQVTGINIVARDPEPVIHNHSDEDVATTQSYKFTELAVIFNDITDQVQ